MNRFSLGLLILFLLVGCQSQQANDASTPALTMKLISPLVIPANSAHINFQHGKTSAGRNLYEKHCEFEITTVSESPQRIEPDRMRVSRSMRRVVSDEQSGMLRVPFGLLSCGEIYYETHFWLTANKQQTIRKLVCREGFAGCGGRHMTLGEIQQTLGSQLQFENAADLIP